MTKTFLYPYKDGSASAKALAQALNIKRIKREGSKFKPKGKTIINWGSSDLPALYGVARVLNTPDKIARATNKLAFFRLMEQAGLNDDVVKWTTSHSDVQDWLNEGGVVVARTKLTGHSGEGIELVEGVAAEIPEAPLYTLYTPKKHEFRIHCVRTQILGQPGSGAYALDIFDIQRKARKSDVPDEDVNWKVRNLGGGFIYAREGFTLPDVVKDVALRIFEATGLDFGAVDIIYNEKHNRAYALELNTAPGLSGTTLNNYVTMLKELIDG